MTSRLILTQIVLASLAVALCRAAAPATLPTTAPATTQEISPAVTLFMKPVDGTADDDALRQKLKERHNSLVRILELYVQGYRKGTSDAAHIFDAVQTVAEAKMELAQTDRERETAVQQLLDVTKVIEARAEKQIKSGFGSEIELERARVLRESAEVELLKLKRPEQAPTTRPQ